MLLQWVFGIAIGIGIGIVFKTIAGRTTDSADRSDPDGVVLAKLRAAGSRLGYPHAVQFFLYFPTEAAAQDAAEQLKAEGFEVTIQPASTGPSFLCQARKSMVPTHTALVDIRARFARLTASLGGEYDGWGAGVVK
jgi:hypothetical protein